MNGKRLVQLLGDMWEELWFFPQDTSDEEIQRLFKEYRDSDYETFEEYIESLGDYAALAERVFVDEIIIEN